MAASLRSQLESDRYAVGDAANAALGGELPAELAEALLDAIGRMESALRRRRLPGQAP